MHKLTRRMFIAILNLNALNTASQYMNQKLIELQKEIDASTIIVGVFNTPPSQMGKPSRQKISKDMLNSIAPSVNWI